MINTKDSARKAQILEKATALTYGIMVRDTEGIGKMTNTMDLVYTLGQMVTSILVSTKTTKDQVKEYTSGQMATST